MLQREPRVRTKVNEQRFYDRVVSSELPEWAGLWQNLRPLVSPVVLG